MSADDAAGLRFNVALPQSESQVLLGNKKQNKTERNFWSYMFGTYLKLVHCVSLFTRPSQPGGNRAQFRESQLAAFFEKRSYYMYPDIFLYKCDVTQKLHTAYF